MIRRFLNGVLLVALVAGIEPLAAAEPGPTRPTARAIALVQEFSLCLQAIDKTSTDRARTRAALLDALDRYFDLVGLAESTAGAALKVAPPAERTTFMTAFREYLVAIVLQRFATHEGEALEFVGARELPGARVRVVTRIVDAGGRSRELDWLVGPADPPRIVDLVLEGVRLGSQLQAEFTAVLEHSDQRLSALIEAMARVSAVDRQ